MVFLIALKNVCLFLQYYGFSVTWILKSLEKCDAYNTIKVRFNNLVVNDTARCDKKNKPQQYVNQQVEVF
jgi:hypothetical protein